MMLIDQPEGVPGDDLAKVHRIDVPEALAAKRRRRPGETDEEYRARMLRESSLGDGA